MLELGELSSRLLCGCLAAVSRDKKNQEIPPSLPHINAAELKIQITADGGPEQKK